MILTKNNQKRLHNIAVVKCSRRFFFRNAYKRKGVMMKIKKDEKGYLMLEAAIVYPIWMIVIVFFLYVLLLAAQRAQMVSAAEQTLIYVKYVCSGNYDLKKYKVEEGMDELPVIEESAELYNVYARLFDTSAARAKDLKKDGQIDKIFKYYLKTPLLGNFDGDYTVDSEINNYIIFTELDLTVSYKMKQVINFSYIGGEAFNHPTFTINVKGVISDNTETIRTLQYVDYLLCDRGPLSKVGETIGNIVGSIKEWFGIKK